MEQSTLRLEHLTIHSTPEDAAISLIAVMHASRCGRVDGGDGLYSTQRLQRRAT